MKTPLRILTGALAAASVVAAVPAGANPGSQRAAGGPGASALLQHGVLTMHWPGGSARLHVPAGYRLPAVTARGELGGVSFDGHTVVLAGGRPGQGGRTRFLVAERGTLTPLAFKGTVAFDAIAPSGASLYLTRHTSASDPTRYVVLQYDRSRQTLNQVGVKVVFSAAGSEQPSWKMQGLPLSRASEPTGQWAYTLYTAREYPFIHALPLGQGAAAVCIELPRAWRSRVASLHLRAPGGQVVEVLDAGGAVVARADLTRNRLELVQPA